MNLISDLSNGAVILLVLVSFFLATTTHRKNRRDALQMFFIRSSPTLDVIGRLFGG